MREAIIEGTIKWSTTPGREFLKVIPGVAHLSLRVKGTMRFRSIEYIAKFILAGQIVQQSNTLSSTLQISIGGAPAKADYSGLSPNYAGLYQFNIVVPEVAASNAAPLSFTLGGTGGTQTLYIAIGN
jgi:hypothetical protein